MPALDELNTTYLKIGTKTTKPRLKRSKGSFDEPPKRRFNKQRVSSQTQFEAIALSYMWSARERATALVIALRGSALVVLQFIPAKDRDNFEFLTDAQDRRYGN
ncbi:hypothetical protein HELRODRAFT_162983 [Helobdella robusta]|uniref:Uncharacterized protein n=1 Tax=Helobdella robusta TaxID=6412 RepID=T1ETH7_HELRO|nr:hypothetical protein HELRODRAFT_162983 [Helobdella robusta]ESN99435.1 hypothetical protein HELRODRAFT_162983 [Helobdella robusta]